MNVEKLASRSGGARAFRKREHGAFRTMPSLGVRSCFSLEIGVSRNDCTRSSIRHTGDLGQRVRLVR
jgi:hypothetical protein